MAGEDLEGMHTALLYFKDREGNRWMAPALIGELHPTFPTNLRPLPTGEHEVANLTDDRSRFRIESITVVVAD